MFQRNSNKMSRLSVIVRVNVVLSRAVIDSRFDVSSVLRFFLSLALVRSRRKVVIAFCATRMVYCTTVIHAQKLQRCL